MTFLSKLRNLIGSREDDGLDEIANLMQAAQEDEVLRKQILFLVKAPAIHRKSLVATALHEMELRGEAKSTRATFALLATDDGARIAAEILQAR